MKKKMVLDETAEAKYYDEHTFAFDRHFDQFEGTGRLP